ncbi:hypothetical protein BDR22DRAFT_711041 [Usnea florida]
MCIQWCCKNCQDKLTVLTHHWARERCNDYYIARSEDRTVTDCPLGPWILRRAYHRNPYKGAQRCDDCIRAGRKDSKRVQLARQKTNVAHGDRREYAGALYVGELVIPEGFQHTPRPLVRSQLDVTKSDREDLGLANKHLPSHELERERAAKLAPSDVGVYTQSMGNTSIVRQQVNGGDRDRRMAPAETIYRSPYQPVQHHPIQYIYEGKSAVGEDDPRNMDPYTKLYRNPPCYSPLAAGTPQGSFQENSYSNNYTTNQNPGTTVQGQAAEETHRGAQQQLNLPLRASSSRSTRVRPWDL